MVKSMTREKRTQKHRDIGKFRVKRTGQNFLNLEKFNPGGVEQSILRKRSELGGELGLLLSRV